MRGPQAPPPKLDVEELPPKRPTLPDNAQWRRDWYALFMIVRGLVTIQGAQLHHVTQIARECGILFINLPEEEVENLPNGVSIEIDGQAGTLMVL